MTRIVAASLFVFVIAPSIAEACKCRNFRACEALARVPVAFVGLVTEDLAVSRQDPAARVGPRRYRITIERAIRGTPGNTIELIAGGGEGNCGIAFAKGERYLVYATKKDGFLTTHLCTGTRPVAQAADHLAYFDRPPAPPAASHVTGMVYLDVPHGRKPSPGPMANVRVVARGKGFSRETTTDARGSFEFRQMPVAPFSMTAFPPAPFAVARGDEQHDMPDPRQCTRIFLSVTYDGRLAGKIQDAGGRPIAGVPVHARAWTVGSSIAQTKTDSGGAYELQGLPPGRYMVGVNINQPPSVDAPYDAVFSPGTSIESKAVPITLAAGQHKQVTTLTMPAALKTVPLRGCVTMPDRQPATEAIVGIGWARDGIFGSRDEPVDLDSRGCFAIRGYEGNRYTLRATFPLPKGSSLRTEHEGIIRGESAPLSLTLEAPGGRR